MRNFRCRLTNSAFVRIFDNDRKRRERRESGGAARKDERRDPLPPRRGILLAILADRCHCDERVKEKEREREISGISNGSMKAFNTEWIRNNGGTMPGTETALNRTCQTRALLRIKGANVQIFKGKAERGRKLRDRW